MEEEGEGEVERPESSSSSSSSSSIKFQSRIEFVFSRLFTGLLLLCSPCVGYRCRLGVELRGRYFQGGGVGEVVVRERSISTKGTCVEQNQNYYLFDQRNNSCFVCLKIFPRHENILQFKESLCVSPDRLQRICALIREDAHFSTLVRESFVAVTCPFEVAYLVNYNDVTYGFCSHPMSYARPCANRTAYHVHFQHCVNEASLNGREMTLECVAKWIDDSENYFYGRLSETSEEIGKSTPSQSHATSSSHDDPFRCFKYHVQSNEVFLAMSADSSCHGVRSYSNGPIVMEMIRDDFGWPEITCAFPDWLRNTTWRDLNGASTFRLSDSGETLMESGRGSGVGASRRGHCATSGTTSAIYRCVQILDYHRLEEEFIILGFSTVDCQLSKLQCLKFRRMSESVAQFFRGDLMEFGRQGRCIDEDAFGFMRLLIPADGRHRSACPMPGLHHTALRGGCLHRFDVGCRDESIIQIETTCGGDQSTGLLLDCVVFWKTKEKSFVITRDGDGALECFSFVRKGDGLLFRPSDDDCESTARSSVNGNPVVNGDSVDRSTNAYAIARTEFCHSAIAFLPLRRVVMTTVTSPALLNSSSGADYRDFDDYDSGSDYDDNNDDDGNSQAKTPTDVIVVIGDDVTGRPQSQRHHHVTRDDVSSVARWSHGLSFSRGLGEKSSAVNFRRNEEFHEHRAERRNFGSVFGGAARSVFAFLSSSVPYLTVLESVFGLFQCSSLFDC